MELADNQYFSDVMMKYFLILIEYGIYQYRQNSVYIPNYPDDKCKGIFEAMKEIALDGTNVICFNFDKNFPVQEYNNLSFIGERSIYSATVPSCEFLFVYGAVESLKVKYLCNYYNPKFIVHC